MPQGRLKNTLRSLDWIYEAPVHKKSQSVFGGIVSIACIISAVAYISYIVSTQQPTFRSNTDIIETVGIVHPIVFNNTIDFASNLTYTYPPGSPCYTAMKNNPDYAHMLDWTEEAPGDLPFGIPTTLPICQQFSNTTGLDSIAASQQGLKIITFRIRDIKSWILAVSPDTSVFQLPHTFVTRNVPVRMTLSRNTDADGAVTMETWRPSTSVGISSIESSCDRFFPFPFTMTCESLLVTTAPSFIFLSEVEDPFNIVDWWFARIFVISLIVAVGSMIKLVFRRIKRWWTDEEYPENTEGLSEGEEDAFDRV